MVYHSGLFPRALVWALVGLATASQVNGAKADPSVAAAVAAPKSLGDLTGPWILFVDDSPVARRSQVVRRYHAFNKHPANPVLKADQPWEQSVYLYGTVLPGEQRKGYRAWYHGTGRAMSNRGYFSAYAESNDGVHWTKPPLGIVPWQGNTNNNMILDRRRSPGDDHHPQVIHTPWDPDPARRYRMLTFAYSDGYWASYSPDGIHWDDAAHNPVLVDPGDVGNFNWDPHRQAYIGCTKLWLQVRGVNRRCVQFTQTRDFGSWPGAQLILTPDEADDRLRGGKPDFYGLSAFPYESMYIGFLWVYNANGGDDTINVELVSSHDGARWLRQEEPRPPILPLGSLGQWDDGMVFTPNHPVVDGDTIKLFYGGFDGPHKNPGARGAIGLATLRKDGFASLDAGEDPGLVITRDLIRAAGPLRINARATGGWLKAELLDERGEVIAGYSRDDCEAFTGDNVAHTLRWAEKTGLPAAGRLRVRFVMRHASLFSFTAGAESRLAEDVLDIGSRLEPMVDDHLMDRLTDVEHRLHPPRPAPCS